MSALGLCLGCRVTGWWPPHIPTNLLMIVTIYLSFAYVNHSDGISNCLIACHIFLPLPVSSFFQIPAHGVCPLTEELNIRTLHCSWIFLILLLNIMSVSPPPLFIPFPLEDAWSHLEIFTHFSLCNLKISGRPAYMPLIRGNIQPLGDTLWPVLLVGCGVELEFLVMIGFGSTSKTSWNKTNPLYLFGQPIAHLKAII